MFESLRKMMLIGVGAADMAADKLRQMVDDFVERGEISMEEGRKLYNELLSRADEQRQTANERIKTQVRETLKDLGVADRTQVAMLESRIDSLERKIDQMAFPEKESVEG
ncbi:MAG TPA: phasin family protein [Armatimonadota bacterium]|nr:phasin family protein [Armatimonadota bacterium]